MSCWYAWCYCAGRMWCHCRMVYLPMCYVYGKRFVGRITPLILELRNELFKTPYSEIDWDNARNLCAKVFPPPFLLVLMCMKQFINTIMQVLMRPWWARINEKPQVDLVVPMRSSLSTESLISPIPKVQSIKEVPLPKLCLLRIPIAKILSLHSHFFVWTAIHVTNCACLNTIVWKKNQFERYSL
jgi:hypothetical protein